MSDLREALDDAWEGEDDGDTLAPASEVVEDSDVSELQEDTEVEAGAEPGPRDESERAFPEGEEPKDTPAEGGEPKLAEGDEPAPLGWSPEAREGWGDIPKAARAQIAQREQDMERAMANTQLARQESQVLNQIAGKYSAVMAAEGVSNPFQAIEGMFQTVSQLRMGTAEGKAQQIANMIKNYGVDIQALDSLLVGESPETNQNDQLASMIDQRMQPVNQMMNQLAGMQQNKVQEQHGAADAEIHQFASSAEFLNDVRYDMADLMDLATQRGQNMSLQQAYDKACSVHPEISQVLAKRQQQDSLLNKQGAAMSISGTGHEAASDNKTTTLGQDVRAAWDAYR